MPVEINGVQYSLEAKDPKEVSKLWQLFQIFFYICSIVASFFVIFCLSDVILVMQHNCILSAELFLVRASNFSVMENNISCCVDIICSKFHTQPCNIVLFTPVVVATFACFFTTMFVICGRGGAGKEIPDAWRLVIPTIIFNSVSFSFVLYAAITFQNGVHIFLDNIKRIWSVRNIDLFDIDCLQLKNKIIGERLSNGLLKVRLHIWLLVTLWGLGLLWIVLRFLFAVDFHLVAITNPSVTTIHKPILKDSRVHFIEDDGQNIIPDSKESRSDVSNESFYTAESELRLRESEETVLSQPQEQTPTDNTQELPQLRDASTSTIQLRDVATSTDSFFLHD